jgi:perosamine synthetase
MIPYGRQIVDESDIQAVVDVLRGDWLTGGPTVTQFEERIAAYCGAKHVVAVSNGTAALHIAMLAAGIGPGDKVVTSPNTFLASANCAEYVGAEACFSDIEADSYNLDVAKLAHSWQAGTKAVVAVDFAGRPCDMSAIYSLAQSHGAYVIEDAAHAIGSRLSVGDKNYRVGGHHWADLTTFSFHPVKTITCGEGGAIATNCDQLAERCRLLRNHGTEKRREHEPWHYEMHEPGYNYRITDIQSALGLSQLAKLESFIDRRLEITATYNESFADLNWIQPPVKSASRTAWHLYVVQIDFQALGKTRTEVMAELLAQGVGTQVHYIPVHLQPYYQKKYGYRQGDFPVAEAYYQSCLSLPLHPAMSDRDVELVIDAVTGLCT